MASDELKQSRIENLKQYQSTRQQNKLERAEQAIEQLTQAGAMVDFDVVAELADISISYLYKQAELKRKIIQLRDQAASAPSNSGLGYLPQKKSKLISRLQKRILELENEIKKVKTEEKKETKELREKNEALAGHLHRVYSLENQIKKQSETIQILEAKLKQAYDQFGAKQGSNNIDYIPTSPNLSNSKNNTNCSTTSSEVSISTESPEKCLDDCQIRQEIMFAGVKLSKGLEQVIYNHEQSKILLAIQAFKQYKKTHSVRNPQGCLRRAIEESWVPYQTIPLETDDYYEFQQFYREAVESRFLVDIPINHLPIESGEAVVKINRPSIYGPWTPMRWREAQLQYDQLNLN